VYGKKKNLKSYNHNPSKQTGSIFVNEALTPRRGELYGKVRQLVKRKKLNSCWTYDGRIYANTDSQRGSKIVINSLEDLERFQEEEDASIEQFMTSTPTAT
jgi:hypothetical protein